MGGQEVDAGPWPPATPVELVSRPGQTLGELRHLAVLTLPIRTDGIAIPVVPLRPARCEPAHLISAGSTIPRFGDQLDLLQHRVLADGAEEATLLIEAMWLTRQDRPEIEPETVDVHIFGPVSQAVGHHLDDARMAQIDRVSGPGVVDVVARLVRQQAVIARVVDTLERERCALFVALGRVVVDHVEDDFEAGIVQPGDHFLELGKRKVGIAGIAADRREEADRVVAPVVHHALVEQVVIVDEAMDRQQFDRGHADRLEVPDDSRVGQAAEGAAIRLRYIGVELGIAAHVQLCDHELIPAQPRRPIGAPRESAVDDPALGHVFRAVAFVEGEVVAGLDLVAEQRRVPVDLADERLGIRVEQQLVMVEPMTLFGRIRAVHAVTVDGAGPRLGHETVEDLVGVFRQFEPLELRFASVVEEAEFNFGGVGGEDGEVHAEPGPGGAARGGAALENARLRDTDAHHVPLRMSCPNTIRGH